MINLRTLLALKYGVGKANVIHEYVYSCRVITFVAIFLGKPRSVTCIIIDRQSAALIYCRYLYLSETRKHKKTVSHN